MPYRDTYIIERGAFCPSDVCVVWQRTTPLIVMEDAGTATLEIQLQDRVGNAIQLPYPVVLEITTTGDSATGIITY